MPKNTNPEQALNLSAREVSTLEAAVSRLERESEAASSSEQSARRARLLGQGADGAVATACAVATDLSRELASAHAALADARSRMTLEAQRVIDAELLTLDAQESQLQAMDTERNRRVGEAFAALFIALARDGKAMVHRPDDPYTGLLSLGRQLAPGSGMVAYAKSFAVALEKQLEGRHPSDLAETLTDQHRAIAQRRKAIRSAGTEPLIQGAMDKARAE